VTHTSGGTDRRGNDLGRPALRAVSGFPDPGLETTLDRDASALGQGLRRALGDVLPGHHVVELGLAGVVGGEYGEWLAGRSREDDAGPMLAEARAIFERLKAEPWMARVERTGRSAPQPVASGNT